MKKIKNYIYSQVANHNLSQNEAKQMLLEMKESSDKFEDEIAIIGMSGKFPNANNLEEYWDNIKNGVRCIGELPEERVRDAEQYLLRFLYDRLAANGAIKEDGHLDVNYEIRGYLKEIDKFDAAFFGIPPREAKAMDPAQRLFLETAYEAIEDAGYCGSKVYGTNTGVFVGTDHVAELKYKTIAANDPMVVTGTWPGILASRISYIYDFKGPSMVIDTACSSGLVSVHMACNAIKNGECEMAIAGGLGNFYYGPLRFKEDLKELESVESPDNTVRTFDKKANGTTWGEGVGAVLLKPLSKALQDGDVIHAVIKASAINNDGASNGITAPDAGAQENLLLTAWKKANISPETVQYVEVHGTGTVLGDPIEIKALTNAFRASTDKRQFCGIGSVKTGIGHLVGASGLASLLKVVMMLKNKTMPATLNFTEPNSFINFCDSPVYVNDKLNQWESEETPRRAGVNSFGFSGTNCHVVLEEAPVRVNNEAAKTEFEVFTLSAKNQNVLKELINNCDKEFSNNELDLQSVCYTANAGRGHYSNRIALLVKNYKELKDKIKYLSQVDFNEINKFGVYYGEYKIVPNSKQTREKGEIDEGERRTFTKNAEAKLQELVEDYSYPTAAELCELYVKGGNIEWDKLYDGANRRKVSIPIYPLERTRHWYEEKVEDRDITNVNKKKVAKEINHPLVDRCLAESFYQDIYATEFSVDRHWVLSDHKILGNYVIPGTTYIEMAIEVSKKYYGGNVDIREMVYYTPVVVTGDETREVQSILIKQKDHIEIAFVSKINSDEIDEQWIKHAECKAYKISEAAEKVYDLEAIREKLNSEKDEEKLIDTTPRESAIALGERWDNAKILSVGRNEALIELELPEHIAYDINDFCLHVSMLDNAVNAVSQKIGKGLYLPFFYKSIKVTGRMQNKFYSYIRINEKMLKGMETITFDVSLMDAKGKVFAEVTDYSIKKVNETEFQLKNARGVSNIYFQVDWINKELPADLKDLSGEKILIFKDKRGISEGLINQLENSDCSIVEVEIGSVFEKIAQDKYIINGGESDYNSLLQELAEKGITKIIHAATLTDNGEIKDLSGFKEQQKLGVFSLFNLAKALVNHKLNKELDIVLISDYAHEVSKHEAKINPHNAALLTLGKIVNLEHTNLKCRAIDIDENTSVEGILNELRAEETAYKVAYRENKRFIEEFGKLELEEDAENKVEIKDKGVYIITGGTGGLGLEMGKYIASKNNAKIAFINRSKFPERDKWDEILKDENEKKYSRAIMAIREMESLGAEVNCYSMDVINLDGMKIVLDELRAKYGVINGIIHCAGLAGNGFMMRKEKEVFESVVNPKMQGAWILDHLTENDNLDFFVVFSSILSIFGDPGQSDYASANAYLDSFAAYRQRKGKRTRAINWPAWKDTGMAVDFGIVNLENTVNPIPTSNAMSSFEEILNSKSVRALPGELNYSKILDIKESLTFKLSDKLESVLEKHRINLNQKNKSEAGDRSSTRVTIKGKDECSETENILAEIWSQVLGFDEIDIYDNFSSMGGDSLMAIQLLKNINKVFEGIIDISDIYSYPSVQQMASYIDEKLAKNNPQEEFIEENEEESLENNLNSLMDSLQSGETSLEDALSILGGELD